MNKYVRLLRKSILAELIQELSQEMIKDIHTGKVKHYRDTEQEGGPGDQRQLEMPIEAIENIPAAGESRQPVQEPQALPAPLDTNVDGDELDHATMEAKNQPHVPQPAAEDMEVVKTL